jgi:hypothetical protein
VTEHLPSKQRVLNSTPSTAKKKETINKNPKMSLEHCQRVKCTGLDGMLENLALLLMLLQHIKARKPDF